VVDIKLGKEIQNVFIAPNPIEVLIDRLRKRLFVSYNHLPSLKDSIGGIVMFDVENLKVLNSWRIQNKGLFLDDETGEIYFTSKDKIAKINPNNGKIDVVVSNTKSTEIWYSVAYDNKKKILLIGNAKNYTVEGEVIIFEYFNSNFNFVKSVSVGLNPTEIVIKQ
ncbi:MAG: hypothetical protein N2560_02745, partial [Ignavibacteria bacterium]|nr:hypothetical protein [Ignavibacteria bacterium]